MGGKVNTNPGGQNARFKGSKMWAGRAIRDGEEVFVRGVWRGIQGRRRNAVNGERSGWGVFKKRFYRDMG